MLRLTIANSRLNRSNHLFYIYLDVPENEGGDAVYHMHYCQHEDEYVKLVNAVCSHKGIFSLEKMIIKC